MRLTLALLLCMTLAVGCIDAGKFFPFMFMIGNNRVQGTSSDNNYKSGDNAKLDVEQEKGTNWEFYFWLAVAAGFASWLIIATPVGVYIKHRMNVWRSTAKHNIKKIEEIKKVSNKEEVKEIEGNLAKNQDYKVRETVKLVKNG